MLIKEIMFINNNIPIVTIIITCKITIILKRKVAAMFLINKSKKLLIWTNINKHNSYSLQ